ncbi:flagellin [Photobacterium ganghwense]|uniref:Flagellin n=1 Tax=Photobacterium ganghwense TaxID=320778 RepID=A0A0J1HEF2_9GAMM|nr:hypothetical protein [Photobacterium ganghwense]KLV09993.1 hypothetical protein ABT57_10030 [Photobacterium ganghwense]PSU09154.1 flagellin [Photobacterium ganghwense]
MVNATADVGPQSVRLAGQGQTTITPSAVTERSAAEVPATRPARMVSAPQGHFSVSKAVLAKGQHQATTVQVAQQALLQVGRELQSMKRVLAQSLSSQQPAPPSSNDKLAHSQQVIRHTLDSARTQEGRVLDAQLKVQLNGQAGRAFTIPGLNLTRLRHQAEQLRLDFPQAGAVTLQFDPRLDDKQLVRQLDRNLIPLGMRAAATDGGELVFKTTDSAYLQMHQQVLVTGQGHRYPAGQPNQIRLQPEPEGVEDLSISTAHRDGIRQTLSKVNLHLRQVQQSLDDIKAYQAQLAQQMEQQLERLGTQGDVAAAEGRLSHLSAQFSGGFSATYQAITAQANVHRHTVVALLRS